MAKPSKQSKGRILLVDDDGAYDEDGLNGRDDDGDGGIDENCAGGDDCDDGDGDIRGLSGVGLRFLRFVPEVGAAKAKGSEIAGTANVMMAACLATGQTVIESAACEPEIENLADYLCAMGAQIRGAGTPRLVIEGVEELRGDVFAAQLAYGAALMLGVQALVSLGVNTGLLPTAPAGG